MLFKRTEQAKHGLIHDDEIAAALMITANKPYLKFYIPANGKHIRNICMYKCAMITLEALQN
jgi:hypothetical protein